jgi:hypothetical protein
LRNFYALKRVRKNFAFYLSNPSPIFRLAFFPLVLFALGLAPRTAAAQTIYEAENGVLSGGTYVANSIPGYSL